MTPHAPPVYDPTLIERLTQEHRSLAELFQQATRAVQQGDRTAFEQGVAQCVAALDAHIAVEDTQLYDYLQQQARGDPRQTQVVQTFRREMDIIGRNVQVYLGDYLHHPAPVFNFEKAHLDFLDLRALLRERVQREEALLYPMYERTRTPPR